MRALAMVTLAGGGKHGGKLLVLVALVVVIVALIAGWAFFASKARAARGKKP